MVKNPVLGSLAQQMWSFDSPAQVYIRHFPRLVGLPFGELFKYFPDGTVLGLYDTEKEKCSINPRTDRLVTETSDLVMLHPTSVRAAEYRPSLFPADAEIGERPRFGMHSIFIVSAAPIGLDLGTGLSPCWMYLGFDLEAEVAALWLSVMLLCALIRVTKAFNLYAAYIIWPASADLCLVITAPA